MEQTSINMDKLFLLNPDFTDPRLAPEGQLYFCPYNAMMEGILKYYPELKKKMDIRYVDFPRPRTEVADLVGEENQGLPLMIIGSRSEADFVKEYQGVRFVQGPAEIASYLGAEHGIAIPHP